MSLARRDEGGAIAILTAVVAIVLFMAGAFAVDLGQVYAKRSALQSNVDMAVMAAAAELTQEAGCNAEVVSKAGAFLIKDTNMVHGQVTLDLQDGDPGNGEIACPGNWRVELISPEARVDYAMADVFESGDSIDVPAAAAAQIKSPSHSRSLPMYAVQGCDKGLQVISDPPPGPPPTSSVPELVPDSDPPNNNNAKVSNVIPAEVPSGTTTAQVTINGSQFAGVTKVGFSNGPVQWESPSIGLVSPNKVESVAVPTEVLNAEGLWWVRVFKDGKWSKEDDAQSFTVGDLLFCDGAISGNFGTLKISRSGVPTSEWLSLNIALGLEPFLSTYPVSGATSCADGVAPAVTSEHAPPNDGTNCVGTDPGFPNAAGTDGLVTGESGKPGRLNADTTPGCSRNSDDARTASTVTHPAVALNDDVLSCFIVDPAKTVQDVVNGTPDILSPDIYNSPRFFQIPILPVEATNGSSNFYPIVDFRPGFITDQPMTATQDNPQAASISTYNGIQFQTGHVEKVSVILFDEASLPGTAPAVGGEIDYTGSGPKVLVLVK